MNDLRTLASISEQDINVGPGEWAAAAAAAWDLVARCGGEPPYTVLVAQSLDPVVNSTLLIYLARHLRDLLVARAAAHEIDADYFISEYAARMMESEQQSAQARTRLRLVTPDEG